LVKVVNEQLKSVARDYGPLWPISVDASSETDIIAANDALNLYTFSLNHQPGRTALERKSNWHLADFVTKFIQGSLSQDIGGAQFVTKELFFTASGRIGMLLDITDPDPQLPLLLTSLERNMAYVIEGVGGESHAKYRAPKSTSGRTDADSAATGFLDGDFIEQFISLTNSRQTIRRIMEGTSEPETIHMPIEDLQKVVENLQSMH
jgi:DNA damage-binding protein 1